MGNRAEPFEGQDILRLLRDDPEADNELTRGRIRTIYVRLKYGQAKVYEVAEYYGLPKELIRDIKDGKIFANITSASYEQE